MGPLGEDVLVGGVEAGGTKFVCAIGSGPRELMLARRQFDCSEDPGIVLAEVAAWFESEQRRHGRIGAVGVASFGPIALNPTSPAYGRITATPKPGWSNADVVGSLRRALGGIPVGFDTDVNGAALGERRWGAARGLSDFVYITLGTGIGGGGMAGGRLLHGLIHPEMGHLRLPRIAGDDFPGTCPFHGDCWEGLCAGPAIEARTGRRAEQLPAEDPAWPLVARYAGLAIANIICVLSPQRVILGGGVRKGGQLGAEEFVHLVRGAAQASLNGYLRAPALLTDEAFRDYIVPPQLGDDAGVCGAMALAQNAVRQG